MWETLSRSWHFAKLSYGILWRHKQLILFPMFSTIAALIVTASFLLPLWSTGTIAQWMESGDQSNTQMYVTLFLFYFCNYFVIVFFNSGLTAAAMKVLNNEEPSVREGLRTASQRLTQIIGWAVVSAVIGVLLKVIENSNKRAGAFISAILGSAWTALAYFVVPVIVIEGLGPVEAFKQSTSILRRTWGTALVGNFSLGLLSFLIAIPVVLLLFFLFAAVGSLGQPAILFSFLFVAVVLVLILASASGAADIIFKAILYRHATGRSIPSGIHSSEFDSAFVPSR